MRVFFFILNFAPPFGTKRLTLSAFIPPIGGVMSNIDFLPSLQGEELCSIGGPVDVHRTTNGGRPPINKQVPPESVGGKTLFCGTDGRFYNADGKELKPSTHKARDRKRCHTRYPFMCHFASRHCHHLVWETFVGPRTKGMEIDHINGDMMNWSLDNLQEVTPAENRRRARILRILRKTGRDPKQMTRAELLDLFAHYDFDKLDFDARMDRDMSHHMEC